MSPFVFLEAIVALAFAGAFAVIGYEGRKAWVARDWPHVVFSAWSFLLFVFLAGFYWTGHPDAGYSDVVEDAEKTAQEITESYRRYEAEIMSRTPNRREP